MDVLVPTKWCDAGLLEEGDVDLAQFALTMKDSEYMMQLDTARLKDDGQVEEEAVGSYMPIYAAVRVSDTTMTRTLSLRIFKNFLQATLLKAGEKGETHVSMAGGKLRIPDPPTTIKLSGSAGLVLHLSEDVFLRLYSYAYLQGFRMHWVEQRTTVFRLFMDLDFKQPEGIPAASIERVAYVVSRTVKTFFPSTVSGRLVCAATMYKVEQCTGCTCSCSTEACPACLLCHGSGCTGRRADAMPCDKCKGSFPIKRKTGIHLLWPEIFVTSEAVWDMRESVIADLAKTFGQRGGPMNPWRDVVDLAVYKACTGLRMMGSRKTDTCPLCKNKRGPSPCGKCGTRGKVDAGRPYAPLFATDAEGKRDKDREAVYRANYYSLLLDTKIRYKGSPTPGFALPPGAPTYATSNQTKPLSLDKTGHEKHTAVARQIAPESPEHEAVQAFFRDTTSHYANVVVESVKRSKDKELLVHVTGTNCRYCQNIGRNHRSNRIYFQITTRGVVQRCHDATDVLDPEMKYGLCRDYASTAMPLPPSVSNIIFPDTTIDIPQVLRTHIPDAKERTLLAYCNRLYRDIYNCPFTSTAFFSGLSCGDRLLQVGGGDRTTFTRFVADAIGQYDTMQVEHAHAPTPHRDPLEARAAALPKRDVLLSSITNITRAILDTLFADEDLAVHLVRIADPTDPWAGDFRALSRIHHQVETVTGLRFE